MASNGDRDRVQRDGAVIRQESGVGIDIPLQTQYRPPSSTQVIISDSMVKEVQEAIDKLLNNKVESLPKEKHIRSIIIATWKEQGCNVFWTTLSKHDLASQALVCWKAMYVLHRVLRDGHAKSISRSTKYLSYLNTLQKRWAMFQGGYNKLSLTYLRVVIEKIKFHVKYPVVPSTFKIELAKVQYTSGDHLFQMEVDILEYESALLSLQGAIFGELDPSKGYTTQVAQCRVAPLVPVIEDQTGIYDLSYHVMQLLHSNLPAELLAGHRERYYRHYNAMRKFLLSSKSLSYVSSLTKIRELSIDPPIFVVEENINEVELMSPISENLPPPPLPEQSIPDESGKDDLIEQLLRENLELKQRLEELEEGGERKDKQIHALGTKLTQLKIALDELKKTRDEALEEKQRLTFEIENLRERTKMEETLNKQKAKLDETLEKLKRCILN
ncbi:hypothetical protein LOD99_11192 [Oopsacas minuta]|uniref:ENTH domain-containing protein n=1 Tax=Oopsacas minuta TaxID=111878 RepID=A0AAV7K8W7_9METZ|nr:hypothetical protein LOD99_11192 [Oopsacas minuta]